MTLPYFIYPTPCTILTRQYLRPRPVTLKDRDATNEYWTLKSLDISKTDGSSRHLQTLHKVHTHLFSFISVYKVTLHSPSDTIVFPIDPRYRWILPRKSRMLHRAMLYKSNPWTLTNGIRSSVQSGLGRDKERRTNSL